MIYRERKKDFSVVRAISEFGIGYKPGNPIKLFLDDTRNPPLNEKGWVVVRNVHDGIWFVHHYGHLIATVSLDNDLGPDPQGYELLDWILKAYYWKPICFPLLSTFIIHTGNMPKWRKMKRMLKGSPFIVKRRVPSDRIYPRMDTDKRSILAYKH